MGAISQHRTHTTAMNPAIPNPVIPLPHALTSPNLPRMKDQQPLLTRRSLRQPIQSGFVAVMRPGLQVCENASAFLPQLPCLCCETLHKNSDIQDWTPAKRKKSY